MPDRRVLVGVFAAALALQILPDLLGGYGYFIDELYYIACARRLDLGYVDHPPLAPFLLRIHSTLFGESIASIRLLPALAGAADRGASGMARVVFRRRALGPGARRPRRHALRRSRS